MQSSQQLFFELKTLGRTKRLRSQSPGPRVPSRRVDACLVHAPKLLAAVHISKLTAARDVCTCRCPHLELSMYAWHRRKGKPSKDKPGMENYFDHSQAANWSGPLVMPVETSEGSIPGVTTISRWLTPKGRIPSTQCPECARLLGVLAGMVLVEEHVGHQRTP